MGLFDKFSKKYDINPEDNAPQIVYGVPEFMIETEEIKNIEMIFSAYEGGYLAPSEFYYIEKIGDNYKFKKGYSPSGLRLDPRNDEKFDVIIKSQSDYDKFIIELKNMTKEWEKNYDNPNILDGTEWYITALESNIDYSGCNIFPNNYKNVKNYINESFKKTNISNYEISPEDNVPREVYGIPSPIQKELNKAGNNYNNHLKKVSDENIKEKYEVDPQKNVPQKVYGVMNPEKFKLDLDKRNKESISVIINNYCLSLTKWGNTCDLLFVNKSKESFIKDSIVSISLEKFEKFVSRINPIVSEWENKYYGAKDINWQIKFNTKQMNKTIVGNGEYPLNWNEFVDLISEYEILFKKIISYDNNNESKIDAKATLDDLVKAKVNDPFWEKLICDYLKQEINESDTVLKMIFESLTMYDDIFNEFTKYLVQKNYDIPGAISVEGYTAKRISELNPNFNATEVYTFLNYLREKPEEAKDIIKKGFPNKNIGFTEKNKEISERDN